MGSTCLYGKVHRCDGRRRHKAGANAFGDSSDDTLSMEENPARFINTLFGASKYGPSETLSGHSFEGIHRHRHRHLHVLLTRLFVKFDFNLIFYNLSDVYIFIDLLYKLWANCASIPMVVVVYLHGQVDSRESMETTLDFYFEPSLLKF